MSLPKPPKPAKLVIGVIASKRRLIHPVTEGIVKHFGAIDLISPWFSFDYTDYYEPEMGKPLFRRMMAFKTLIEQKDLSAAKNITNVIENAFTDNDKRQVNIDPGYMLHEKFVLATGKNFSHRIYIGENIYADLTLIYQKGKFQSLPWTYPDYKAENILLFLHRVRKKYLKDISEKVIIS